MLLPRSTPRDKKLAERGAATRVEVESARRAWRGAALGAARGTDATTRDEDAIAERMME